MSLAQPKTYSDHQIAPSCDVLLSTPVVDALKTRFPDCEIDMLVYAGTEQLIADNPQIAQIFTIDRNWKKLGVFKQLACEKNLLSKLKARDYDWAFNLSDQWRAAVSPNCAPVAAWVWTASSVTVSGGVSVMILSTMSLIPAIISLKIN